MKIALYGGSFNPPHQGHADTVAWLLTRGFQEVWVVPCKTHAFDKELAPIDLRVRMLEMCMPQSCEIVPRGEVYTIDLIENLRRENPHDTFTVVVGADVIGEKEKWHRWDDLNRQCELLVLARGGYPPFGESAGIPPFSSTDIRHSIQRGEAPKGIHPEVLSLIQREGLYK